MARPQVLLVCQVSCYIRTRRWPHRSPPYHPFLFSSTSSSLGLENEEMKRSRRFTAGSRILFPFYLFLFSHFNYSFIYFGPFSRRLYYCWLINYRASETDSSSIHQNDFLKEKYENSFDLSALLLLAGSYRSRGDLRTKLNKKNSTRHCKKNPCNGRRFCN